MKICIQCSQAFETTEVDRQFYNKISPIIGGKKLSLPDPVQCPDCRRLNRIMYRNFRNLYHRNCDKTGKAIISMYDRDAPFPVYDYDVWHGDDWDPMDYGIDYNPNKSFLEQYHALASRVPRFNIQNNECENCRYSNMAWRSNNCYLIFGCILNEDCYFGHIVWESKHCVDCLYVYRSKYCYECVDCVDSYELFFSQECVNCIASYFLFDCRSCENCFGCVGLYQKKYHIFNQAYSKEEYEKKLAELQFLSPQVQQLVKQKMNELKAQHIYRYTIGTQNENVSGNHIYFSRNVHHAFDVKQCEDSKFLYTVRATKDCYDMTFNGGEAELSYNSLALIRARSVIANHLTSQCQHVYYGEFCYNSEHLLGCNGLKYKKYCILNKQYSKKDYDKLVPQIVEQMQANGEWGRFFLPQHSPFAYNESAAQEYLPLSKEDCAAQGFRWKEDLSSKSYKGPTYVIPENIKDVQDDITEHILFCEATGKPYKIITQEFNFYRERRLPIPRLHPDERHRRRMAMRNPRKLWTRTCQKCSVAIETTYAPDRPEVVYCEQCYLKEVY